MARSSFNTSPTIVPGRQAPGQSATPTSRAAKAYEQTPLVLAGFHLTCNIVAVAIVTVITTILVLGIRESARFNAAMVMVKIAAVLFVIVVGIGVRQPLELGPVHALWLAGVRAGAALIFFAYIGFDSVSTHAEEARNPKTDVPIGIISLAGGVHGAVHRRGGRGDGDGALSADPPGCPDRRACSQPARHDGPVAAVIISVGALTGITSVLLVMLLSQPRVLLAMARDGLLPPSFFGAVHPRFRTPYKATILDRASSAARPPRCFRWNR